MPRLKVNKKEYLIQDFSAWLVGTLWSRHITLDQVAGWLNCTRPNVSYKLKHHNFTLEEMIIIFHELDVTEEQLSKLLLY